MKFILKLTMFTIIFSTMFCQPKSDDKKDREIIRPATVAGAFYPASAEELKSMLNDYLKDQKTPVIKTDIFALIAPHAGYIYSGAVAGRAYYHLENHRYDAIIIIAPSHQKYFVGSSVFSGDGYATPLGISKVDKALADSIASYGGLVKLSMDGHSWKDSLNEHAIEVQIPFLQTVQPNVPIVPIVMGSQDYQTVNQLMSAIVSAVKKSHKKVLIVASSDLSHYHTYDEAKQLDLDVAKAFQFFDYFKLETMLFARKLEACGGGPIITAMMAAEQLGGTIAYPVQYANSGDTPAGKDHKDRVVGYFSGLILSSPGMDNLMLPPLSDDDKQELLQYAKSSVENTVKNIETNKSMEMLPTGLARYYTGFVTIKKHGELRACMGHTFAQMPLYFEIGEVAKTAATSDFRFGPITIDELKDLEYEVTVLSRFKRITDTNEIKIGTHGLFIRYKSNSGLLLPQVATERNWDTKTFLENLCYKAGLPKDTYSNPDAELYIFKAIIIN